MWWLRIMKMSFSIEFLVLFVGRLKRYPVNKH